LRQKRGVHVPDGSEFKRWFATPIDLEDEAMLAIRAALI
jgi:hypothetical protein